MVRVPVWCLYTRVPVDTNTKTHPSLQKKKRDTLVAIMKRKRKEKTPRQSKTARIDATRVRAAVPVLLGRREVIVDYLVDDGDAGESVTNPYDSGWEVSPSWLERQVRKAESRRGGKTRKARGQYSTVDCGHVIRAG